MKKVRPGSIHKIYIEHLAAIEKAKVDEMDAQKKGGRPKRAHKFLSERSRRMVKLAELELYRAEKSLKEAMALTDLASAEIDADKAIGRIRLAMALEAELRRLNR